MKDLLHHPLLLVETVVLVVIKMKYKKRNKMKQVY
jgi:hypothetical protein